MSVGEIAGKGGAWGMALLADFLRDGRYDHLASGVFGKAETETVKPVAEDVAGFDA